MSEEIKNEVTVASLAKEMDVKPLAIKKALELAPATPGATVLTEDQIKAVVLADVGAEPAAEPKADKADKKAEPAKEVIYYWGDKRNAQFFIDGVHYKSKNSVMKLDPVTDAKAIKKLEADQFNEKNGGNQFKELATIGDKDTKGHAMDELMTYSQQQLVEMAGGGLDNKRLSTGTLIMKIIDASNK